MVLHLLPCDESAVGIVGKGRHLDTPSIARASDAPVGVVSHAQIRDCHKTATVNHGSYSATFHECGVNVSVVQCDNALIERNSRPCYHTTDPAEKRKEIADASPDTARGAGLDHNHSFPSGDNSSDAEATARRSGIGRAGDSRGACDAAAERTLAVICPVCLGRGTNAHFPWLPCGICFGSGEEHSA